ncbi:YbaB/EbfC family nucleoid-associated protein [Actinotalea ferrariae]|uniref:YbaB/EbfC family nucleoid-associated protein n=1 Tax=Actinotalea ferrariae TaxID=1386098 RepID=UPI001C8CE00C|nr:YbaB/EbfC family nucleoid-associated protein [Actinotalea ferrariae]MBX9245194.1 YbaB/EbfC family nucleoid-associated protein [Actinotalea ferrariae]
MAGTTTDEWVARLQVEAQERLEAAARLEQELAGARATGTSTERSVTVTVGASGVVTDVVFTSVAERLSADQLRAAVLEALGRAQLAMGETVARLTDGIAGAPDVRDLIAGRVPESTRDALQREIAARDER